MQYNKQVGQQKKVMQYRKMIAVLGLGCISNVVLAGGFLGISAGQTDLDLSGYDSDSSYTLAVGMDVLDSLAVELAYVDLVDTRNDNTPAAKLAVDGVNLAVIVKADIGKGFGVYGKAGVYSWDERLDDPVSGRDKESGTDMSIGFGLSWQLTDKVGVNLGLNRYKLDADDADNVALGMVFGL